MPVMDGHRGHARDPPRRGTAADLPIIAMTAHAMADERQRCLDAGMQDHRGQADRSRKRSIGRLRAWCASKTDQPLPTRTRRPRPAARCRRSPAWMRPAACSGVMGNRRALCEAPAPVRAAGSPAPCHRLRESLAAGDRATRGAHRAHGRGVAGNIGALAVQDVAARLERAIGARQEDEALICELETAIGTGRADRRRAGCACGRTAAAAPAPLEPGDDPGRCCARLAALLAASDGERLRCAGRRASRHCARFLGSDYRSARQGGRQLRFRSGPGSACAALGGISTTWQL